MRIQTSLAGRQGWSGSSFGARATERRPCQVSLIRCSVCQERRAEKLTQAYWAWNLAGGARRAYKQRLCVECFRTRLMGITVDMLGNPYNCPLCHLDCEENMDAVYVDLYIPGQPKLRLEMACCPEDAVTLRGLAMEGAELLPERQGGDGGLQPPIVPAMQAWDALGLGMASNAE